MEAKLYSELYNKHDPPKPIDIMQICIIRIQNFQEKGKEEYLQMEHFIEGRDPRTANFPVPNFSFFGPGRFWSVDPWFKELSLSNTIVLQNIPLDYIAVSG